MSHSSSRRRFLSQLSCTLALPYLAGVPSFASERTSASDDLLTKPIPVSGERLPVIGMGTWRTFNVGADPHLRSARSKVLQRFFDAGGTVIDCSPMYGSAARVLGWALARISEPDELFAAEKIWTSDGSETRQQHQDQREDWGNPQIDLQQIHNLLAWEAHLPVLQDMKRDGVIRYVGITTSHRRRHADLEHIMTREQIDFVQLTYNMTHREAEQRLLPLARERDIAVIANRPFDGGYLIKTLKRKHPLPTWARDALQCHTWAEFLLKFIVSHPAVTCAIPATSKLSHMDENMRALRGPLPDASLRQRMLAHIASL